MTDEQYIKMNRNKSYRARRLSDDVVRYKVLFFHHFTANTQKCRATISQSISTTPSTYFTIPNDLASNATRCSQR